MQSQQLGSAAMPLICCEASPEQRLRRAKCKRCISGVAKWYEYYGSLIADRRERTWPLTHSRCGRCSIWGRFMTQELLMNWILLPAVFELAKGKAFPNWWRKNWSSESRLYILQLVLFSHLPSSLVNSTPIAPIYKGPWIRFQQDQSFKKFIWGQSREYSYIPSVARNAKSTCCSI